MGHKIITLGARGNLLCQQDRIDKGLLEIGCELVEENPDLIYVNDAGYHKEGIELKKKYPKAKLILNTLDLPFHVPEFRDICDQLSLNFYFTDAITTISETVKEQMLSTFPHTQRNGISVVYQPVKPVSKILPDRSRIGVSLFGRQNDKNKQFLLAFEAAMIAGLPVSVIGPEDCFDSIKKEYRQFYTYKGLVDDEKLNIEYNTAQVVLICGIVEGISLSLIESICAKTPVVCCSNMATAREFCPPEFICEPNPFAIADKIKYVTSGDEKISKILDTYSEKYLTQFSSESVANNIIKVYENIK